MRRRRMEKEEEEKREEEEDKGEDGKGIGDRNGGVRALIRPCLCPRLQRIYANFKKCEALYQD